MKLLGEIAGRKKTPELVKFLRKEFNENTIPAIQYLALTGLTDLPQKELKPMILKALKSTGILQRYAVFVAVNMKEDAEIQSALSSLTVTAMAGTSPSLLMQKLTSQMCDQEIYE